ncbi:UDP-N-acetylmuramoylalanine--D-glutamate ligase [Candidatus Jorgensenbacteria bacterium GWA1_49_17]|nr:MAG: UDP-N-acetylmuramoylalanine--D-glutamate ligase [Candidatus Jorgensenbacteria bacterium GWA1_49_17]
MGLGLLGGGVATVNWLVKHGAKVTVTDLRTRRELAPSIQALGPTAKKVRFVLGKHRVADFRNNEIVVVNPGVRRESEYLKIAKKAGAELENEASIFFRVCRNPIIGVTGTRGKTTTANWLHHILKKKYPKAVLTGNSSASPMLSVLDKLDGRNPVVVELSSWHLEFLPKSGKVPHVALITNLYPDHLNRYPSMKNYALAKANIFLGQSEDDFLLLNKDNSWTKFFRSRKPKSRIAYFPANVGIDLKKFKKIYGLHNFYNLNAAILVARHFGVPLPEIKKALKTLPKMRFRQEIVLKKKNLTVVNDTTATTPEATRAALLRFAGRENLVLIAGGTDKRLDFSGWAKTVKKLVKPANLYLLEGSATEKMVRELKKIGYFKKIEPQLFEKLESLLKVVRRSRVTNCQLPVTILFSPGATSFEKFKNEFDRGEKFNRFSLSAF